MQKINKLNSCYAADAAGQQPSLLRGLASVMSYCIILVRFYGNAEFGSIESFVFPFVSCISLYGDSRVVNVP